MSYTVKLSDKINPWLRNRLYVAASLTAKKFGRPAYWQTHHMFDTDIQRELGITSLRVLGPAALGAGAVFQVDFESESAYTMSLLRWPCSDETA